MVNLENPRRHGKKCKYGKFPVLWAYHGSVFSHVSTHLEPTWGPTWANPNWADPNLALFRLLTSLLDHLRIGEYRM